MMDEKRTKHRPRVRHSIAVIGILTAMILLVMGVFAACGGVYPDEGSAEEQLRSQLADEKVQEVTVSGTLYLHGPVEINGAKTLKGSGVLKAVGDWAGTEKDYLLVLGGGANVTLAESITVDGNAVSGGVYVSEGAALTVEGQAVVKNSAKNFGNVMAVGSVNVAGGELKGAAGHNLYVSGSAVISGGVISGSGEEFAGVYAAGKLEMTGGEVSGAYDNVYVAEGGSFLWTGGKNLNAVNDGVYVSAGGYLNTTSLSAFMEGAGKQGVHLYGEADVDDVFLVGSGENNIKIEENAVLTMRNGAIDGSKGHGITNRGTLTVYGGEITNSAACGILTTGKLEMTAGSIFNNGNQGILVRNGGNALVKGSTISVSSNNMGIAVEENAYAEVTDCNVNTNTVYNFYSAGDLYLHDLTTGGSGSNCISTNYGGHILAENITINGTSRNNGIYNINGSLIELKNVTIDSTKTNGIRNLDAHLVAENLTITNCGREGISSGDYIYQGAGSIKINGLTMEGNAGSNMAVDTGSTGTIEISNAKLGMAGTNNLKIQGSSVTLTNVELLGNQPGGNSTHGILMDEGATVTATNLLICDTVASGIRNRGGVFKGEQVTMRNLGVDGISNVPHGTTKNPGTVTIRDLSITGATGTNVKSECPGGTVTLTNATLGKCGTNSVRVNSGTVVLNNVVIQGHGAVTKSNSEHGIFIDGGSAVVNSVTIRDTKAAGIRHKGGVLTGSNVTIISAGSDGISCSAGNVGGSLTINGLTVNGSGATNVFNDGPNTVNITGGKLGPTVTNNVRVINGVVNLTDVEILGQTENPKEGNQHGIFIDKGQLNLDTVTIQDTDAAGLRISGGEVSVKNSILQDTGSNGVYQSGGNLTLNGLTIKNNKGDAIGISAGTITGTSVAAVGTPGCGINQSGGSVDIETVDLTGTGTNNGGVKVDAGSFEADTLNIKTFRDGIIVNGGSFTVTKGGTFQGLTRNGMGIGGDVDVNLTGVTVSGFTGTDYAHVGVNAWNEKAEVTLTDCTIDGAKDAVYLSNGNVTMNGGKIINSTQEAVEMNGGSFTSNNTGISKARDGIYINGGTANLSGGTMQVSRNGVSVGGKDGVERTITLNGVTIDQPGQSGVNMWMAGTVNMTDTTITGSGKEGIILSVGTVNVNGNSTVTGSKKAGVQNNGGTVVLNGGYVYGNASGDVNNGKGSLTIGKVTVGYDAEGKAYGGKITSANMINFSGDAMSDIHASGQKLVLEVNGNASNTKLVTFESNAIAVALQDRFDASGKNLAVEDKVLYIIEPIAEVDGKEYSSLSSALEAAQKDGSSGVIKLLKDVVVDETYTISGNVTITDNGEAKTISRGVVKLFDVAASGSLTMKGSAADMLTVSGTGFAADKSAFVVAGKLDMENVTLKDMNAGAYAGGALIYLNKGPAATFTNVTVSGGSGHVINVKGAAFDGKAQTFTNCTFENRTANAAGTVFNGEKGGKVEIDNCTFNNNSSTGHGGVIYIDQAAYTIRNTTFTNNKSTGGHGGAIAVGKKAASKLILENSTFAGNNTVENKGKGMAGAIWVRDDAVAQITGTSFTGSTCATIGGAIMAEANANVTIKGGSFENNTAGSKADNTGGAIYAKGNAKVSIDGTSFTGNKGKWGGAVYAIESVLNVTGATFTGNDANGTQGGAIFAEKTSAVTVSDSTFSGNAAAKGKDIYMKHSTGSLTLSGAVKAEDIWLNQADSIKVTGMLAEGSNLVLHWGAIPTGAAVEFDSVDAAEANYDKLSLSEALRKNYHLRYEGNHAYIAEGADNSVAKVGKIGYATLADAVAAAQSGSNKTVVLLADITLDNTIAITGDVTITDNGTARTITHGDYTGEMFNVTGSLTLTGTSANSLTLNGNGGSGISAIGTKTATVTLNFTNTAFTGHKGAVAVNWGTAQITNCTFSGNTGTSALHAMASSTVTITDTAFTNNSAETNGGAIYVSSGTEGGYRTTLTNCTFTGNSAYEGGAIYASYLHTNSRVTGLTLDSCSFSGNTTAQGRASGDVHYYCEEWGTQNGKAFVLKTSLAPMSVTIYMEAGMQTKVNVSGELKDGSNITFRFNRPQYKHTLNFDSTAAANANVDNISLASAHADTYHFAYNLKWAEVTQGKAVARIGTAVYTDFADAVAAAQSGDTITLMNNVTIDSTVSIDKALTITDDGTARTISRGSGFTGTMFNVTGGVSLTFSSTGSADVKDGKATGNASKLTIDGNGGNVTGAEPAVVATSSHVTVEQSVRFTNFKNASGKPVVQIHKDGGSLTITGGVFDSNTVTGYCGTIAVWNSNSVNISNAVFKDNTCTNNTGSAALYLNCKKVCEVKNCVFDTNNGYNGGAVNVAGSTTVTFTDCVFRDNINNGRRGSSIYVDKGGSQVTINGCAFEGNEKESITVHSTGARTVTVNGTVITTSGAWAAKTDAQLMAIVQEVQ